MIMLYFNLSSQGGSPSWTRLASAAGFFISLPILPDLTPSLLPENIYDDNKNIICARPEEYAQIESEES